MTLKPESYAESGEAIDALLSSVPEHLKDEVWVQSAVLTLQDAKEYLTTMSVLVHRSTRLIQKMVAGVPKNVELSEKKDV